MYYDLHVIEQIDREPALLPVLKRLKGAIHYEQSQSGYKRILVLHGLLNLKSKGDISSARSSNPHTSPVDTNACLVEASLLIRVRSVFF